MIEIKTGTEEKHCVATCPLKDVYHVSFIPPHAVLYSGQPITIFGEDQSTVLGLAFQSYSIDPDGVFDQSAYTAHDVAWSVYDTEAEAQEVADKVNENDFIVLQPIKHPSNAEWAIAFSQPVFDAMPEGDTKTWLADKSAESIANGRRHDSAYMIANGWV